MYTHHTHHTHIIHTHTHTSHTSHTCTHTHTHHTHAPYLCNAIIWKGHCQRIAHMRVSQQIQKQCRANIIQRERVNTHTHTHTHTHRHHDILIIKQCGDQTVIYFIVCIYYTCKYDYTHTHTHTDTHITYLYETSRICVCSDARSESRMLNNKSAVCNISNKE